MQKWSSIYERGQLAVQNGIFLYPHVTWLIVKNLCQYFTIGCQKLDLFNLSARLSSLCLTLTEIIGAMLNCV